MYAERGTADRASAATKRENDDSREAKRTGQRERERENRIESKMEREIERMSERKRGCEETYGHNRGDKTPTRIPPW